MRRLRDQVAKRCVLRQSEDINLVVKEAVELALVGAPQREVRTAILLDPSVGAVSIDRVQIGQVIINLVRNAMEAMEASETRELTVSTHTVAQAVEITVADTGPGIDPVIAARLFLPFVTSKATGLGLGLSICRDLIEGHNGKLSASPRPQGGTAFTICLPLADQTSAE